MTANVPSCSSPGVGFIPSSINKVKNLMAFIMAPIRKLIGGLVLFLKYMYNTLKTEPKKPESKEPKKPESKEPKKPESKVSYFIEREITDQYVHVCRSLLGNNIIQTGNELFLKVDSPATSSKDPLYLALFFRLNMLGGNHIIRFLADSCKAKFWKAYAGSKQVIYISLPKKEENGPMKMFFTMDIPVEAQEIRMIVGSFVVDLNKEKKNTFEVFKALVNGSLLPKENISNIIPCAYKLDTPHICAGYKFKKGNLQRFD